MVSDAQEAANNVEK